MWGMGTGAKQKACVCSSLGLMWEQWIWHEAALLKWTAWSGSTLLSESRGTSLTHTQRNSERKREPRNPCENREEGATHNVQSRDLEFFMYLGHNVCNGWSPSEITWRLTEPTVSLIQCRPIHSLSHQWSWLVAALISAAGNLFIHFKQLGYTALSFQRTATGWFSCCDGLHEKESDQTLALEFAFKFLCRMWENLLHL